MRYNNRAEVERIGQAGAYFYSDGQYDVCRALSAFWVFCEPEDTAFTPHMRRGGHWESWITLWFSQNVPPGSYFFDVGANVGYYSLWASAHGCRVVAFEPNQRCVTAIRRAAAANGFRRLDVDGIALSDVNGTATLHIPNQHSGAGSLTFPGVEGTEQQVQTWRFDDVYDLHGKAPVFMKIDAEGSEPRIWAGMQDAWATGNLTVVLEWHHCRFNAQLFADELFAKARVSLIETDGSERELTKEALLGLPNLEMIVLRPL